ncbi:MULTISPECIES: FxSxx-COOH system tetratricopeptide repeat protein [Streptomyces]|nr:MULTISPECIES: FxSxx-COOH system tetratricopeptide repeat protein [Streptomyces]MCH0559970.1 ATP-binding protein [Streptomyces sp. MUM 16J]
MAGRDVKSATSFHTHNAVLPAGALKSAPRVKAPAGLSNMPQPHGFVGRDRQLAALNAAFATSGEVVVQALHGLGGVGKSTLAAYWASTRSGSSPQWWITAESPAALDAGLADFAVALHPALASTQMGADELREWALLWLAAHRNWLIVLDNVIDPQHVRPVVERAGNGGRFLITSRRATGWHQLSSTVPLDVLEEAEAVELFTRILTHEKQRDSDGAAEVCAEVGFLPLAVEQAASYCVETDISPRHYLGLLDRKPAETFTRTAEGGDADRTIARIWSITLDRLKDMPLAWEVLRVLAWYAPDGIPCGLLDDLAYPPPLRSMVTRLRSQPLGNANALRTRLHRFACHYAERKADRLALSTAIGKLAAYSMIGRQGDTITVHRLVQAFARTPDPMDPYRRARDIAEAQQIAAHAIGRSLPTDPDDPDTWPTWHALLPHVAAHIDCTPPQSETFATARLLREVSNFYSRRGVVSRGIAAGIRAVQIYERLLGRKHYVTLYSRNTLANAYTAAGDFKCAVALFESNLADTEGVFGPDHPDTLASRNNLASAYQGAGDLKRAIPLFESTLADSERIFGSNHLVNLLRRNNLAVAYEGAGDLKRAIPLFESNLADTEGVFGPDHPDTLTCRNNLAAGYQGAGDLKRAIPLFESTLADSERILGADHPDTLMRRNNLANAYESACNLMHAIPLLESTLADSERVLGPDHPKTLTVRHNLAVAYEGAGDLKRAIPLFESTLADSERILGADHPDTLARRDHFANTCKGTKRLHRGPG